MAELSPYQRDILIRTALGEARGEGVDGMADVVHVILNRANSGRFPTDPAEVALQDKQFSTWNKGAGGNNPQQFKPGSKAYQTAADVVNLVASGQAPDMTGGALDYHASNVSPYWADSKKGRYGTIERNGHTFYPTHPVPPGELPSVASLLSVYREAPNPVTSSPDLAQMRRTSAPSRLIADSFAQLPQRAGSSRLADSLALNPVRGGQQTAQPFDAAFDTRTGNMRMLAQPEAVSSQGLGTGTSHAPIDLPRPRPQTASPDLISQSFQRIASSNPTLLPAVPPSTMGRTPQSQIDRGTPRVAAAAPVARPRVTVSTPFTVPQSSIDRGAPRAVAQSPIGQPPATRVVQSVPMPPIAAPISTAVATVSASDRARAARVTPDRLLPGPEYPPALYGGVTGVSLPPTPLPRIARTATPAAPLQQAVASELDVTPMPALPRRRPDLGMGGVDIPDAIAQTGQVAPTPMPRLQRPGLFGRPQILGHDIHLPGILGVIQSATMAMNNASGPFNNGADNSLYNRLRGGDFNTPGAATAQSGGYLYAPRQGGGYINVGRANPAQSGAALYDNLNRRNEFNDDAANRVNGRGGSGGGARSLMS